MTPSPHVRDAVRAELAELAPRLVAQPLLQRYGTKAERLAADLEAAFDAGDLLLVVQPDPTAPVAGLAWAVPRGGLGLGPYLRLIALDPSAHNAGLGTALMDELERLTSVHSRHLFLLVSHHNDGARRFYARRGYIEVGALPSLVRPDTDEVLLWKRLR